MAEEKPPTPAPGTEPKGVTPTSWAKDATGKHAGSTLHGKEGKGGDGAHAKK
jgi:hypothetical protein